MEEGGEGQAFPVYATTRPPRKGKDLESSLFLGRLQLASVCGSQAGECIPGAGHNSFPRENGHPAPPGDDWGYALGTCKGLV